MSLAFHECCIYVTPNQKVLIANAISPAHARGEEYLSIEQLEALSEAGSKSGKGGKGKKAKKKMNLFFFPPSHFSSVPDVCDWTSENLSYL